MSESAQSTLEKLHSETALIPWKDLQRFYAQGNVLCISESLDLVQIAVWFAEDEVIKLASHIDSKALDHLEQSLR